MTAKEFVKGFYLEKESLIKSCFDKNNGTYVSELINDLHLNKEDKEKLKHIVSTLLTDAFYTILLGLDGAASIGNQQHLYKILDEKGNEISGGEIESYAYDYFQDNE